VATVLPTLIGASGSSGISRCQGGTSNAAAKHKKSSIDAFLAPCSSLVTAIRSNGCPIRSSACVRSCFDHRRSYRCCVWQRIAEAGLDVELSKLARLIHEKLKPGGERHSAGVSVIRQG
jgi:hypothetical protein